MSGFPEADAINLLARCHRCCCVCHRFCGVKIELDHIRPRSDGGTDVIENAIPVCFECHAEIHSYNGQHPRGRKFRPHELQSHKEQWLDIVASRPEILLTPRVSDSVGPLQALIDELEFNAAVAAANKAKDTGCPFLTRQFERALECGAISVLSPDLKQDLHQAYRLVFKANQLAPKAAVAGGGSDHIERARKLLEETEPVIRAAFEKLLQYLGHNGTEG